MIMMVMMMMMMMTMTMMMIEQEERGICYLLNRQDFKNGIRMYITYQCELMIAEKKWAL